MANVLYGQLSRAQLSGYYGRVALDHLASETPRATLPLLRQLHEAHTTKIPFETLSLHGYPQVNKHDTVCPISLHQQDVYEKIVVQKRGGTNGLFGMVLRALGFECYTAAARVVGGSASMGKEDQSRIPDFIPLGGQDHQVHIVMLDGDRWLADIGFGGSTCKQPMSLSNHQVEDRCRLRPGIVASSRSEPPDYIHDLPASHGFYKQSQGSGGKWKDDYFFAEVQTPGGRVTLNGNMLKIFEGADVQEQQLRDDQVPEALEQHFGIPQPHA